MEIKITIFRYTEEEFIDALKWLKITMKEQKAELLELDFFGKTIKKNCYTVENNPINDKSVRVLKRESVEIITDDYTTCFSPIVYLQFSDRENKFYFEIPSEDELNLFNEEDYANLDTLYEYYGIGEKVI